MKIENHKIIECTENELWTHWYLHWSDLIDYKTFRMKAISKGIKLKEDKKRNVINQRSGGPNRTK